MAVTWPHLGSYKGMTVKYQLYTIQGIIELQNKLS